MHSIKKITQAIAAVVAGVCSAAMLGVGYYGGKLPDSIMDDGSLPQFSTAVPVTAERSVPAGLNVKLLGSVPIKSIKEETVERPRLAAVGSAFGIKLVTDGVMIIDMKKLSGECPAADAGLRVGDVIESVNGETVSTNAELCDVIKNSGGSSCIVKYRRGSTTRETSITPVLSEGCYRAGMWVRDSSAGIGTMTFIDPETGVFAGLGHSVCDADTHEPLPLSHGTISPVRINDIKKGATGDPGQLIGEFCGDDCGCLTLNCGEGVYGTSDSIPENAREYPMAFSYEVHTGSAFILTQTDNGCPKRFDIVIEKIGGEHDLVISAKDPELIKQAGGIVQGMSGSPIIQDGRLAGAVTHVFIEDPTGGYGIFAERMYRHAVAAKPAEDPRKAG